MALFAAGLLLAARALDNGVGLTPAMGYNTWDDFRCGGINASNLYKVADAMVRQGLPQYGYRYLSLDDCWATSRDPKTGVIQPDPVAFPDGMKVVADYVHSKGLLFGVYTDRGTTTCVGRPGSQGYEEIDAKTYAEWGVDYLKEDSCAATSDHEEAFAQYGKMRDALNKTGRPIYFDLCGWSSWYAPVGKTLGNAWRVGYDVNNWGGVLNNAINVDKNLAQYAGPGGFNDIDALIGTSEKTAVRLTQTQSRTQFNIWSMLSGQLIIGGSILELNPFDLETYTNKEVIAVNQDKLGKQATLQEEHSQKAADGYGPSIQQVWLKELHNGDYAVAFMNTTNSTTPLTGGSASLNIAPCNASDVAQQWNMSAPDPATGAVTISVKGDTDGDAYTQPHCIEINACSYSPGARVDAGFTCKKLPPKGSTDKCASNMAWIPGKNGALVSAFDTSLCLAVAGGGALAACDGSPQQSWTRKGELIESGAGGGCLSNGASGTAPTTLRFSVKALGWGTATFTNLWTGKVSEGDALVSDVSGGDGASQIFRLSRKS